VSIVFDCARRAGVPAPPIGLPSCIASAIASARRRYGLLSFSCGFSATA